MVVCGGLGGVIDAACRGRVRAAERQSGCSPVRSGGGEPAPHGGDHSGAREARDAWSSARRMRSSASAGASDAERARTRAADRDTVVLLGGWRVRRGERRDADSVGADRARAVAVALAAALCGLARSSFDQLRLNTSRGPTGSSTGPSPVLTPGSCARYVGAPPCGAGRSAASRRRSAGGTTLVDEAIWSAATKRSRRRSPSRSVEDVLVTRRRRRDGPCRRPRHPTRSPGRPARAPCRRSEALRPSAEIAARLVKNESRFRGIRFSAR